MRPSVPGGNPLIESTIPTATHWGMIEASVQGGRFVRAAGFSGDAHPTPMIEAFADGVYAQSRVQYPVVRKSFLKSGARAGGQGRGREEFVRVGWDEALDLVASELKRVRTAYGNASIFPGSADWQSSGLLHSASALVRRMLGLFGGFTDCTGDPSIAAAMVILPHILGDLEVYDQQTAWPAIQEHTDFLVLWGVDPLKDNQIGTHPADHYAYGAIERFREKVRAKQARVVVIDPRLTDTAKYLDAEWVAPRPNTDTALMLGMAHVLYEEGRYDKQFIEKYTVGFDQVAAYLTGKSDGVAKSAAWAAGITGVDANVIRDLARRMVQSRTMLMSGYAIQRADHGEQPYWMLVTLASMIGQIGSPGGGFGVSYHYDNGGSLTANAPDVAGISAGENPVKNALPFERVADMFLHPGEQVPYNGTTVTYPHIRLIYWAGGNPLTHLWQTNKAVEAWRRPETIIVQDPFWTATAKFADIVLPATTTFERNDIEVCGAYSHQYIVAMRQVVEPLFESRNDIDILTGVARRLGFEHAFTEGKSDMDWIRSFYAATLKQAAKTKLDMPAFDDFWKKGYVGFSIPEDAASFTGHADFRENPALHPLGTPSGKIELYSKAIEGFHYDDCPPQATWLEPAEWLGSPKAKQYPLHLLSPHPRYRLHSQLDNTWIRSWYEINEREPMWINADDARERGITDGDVVRVFNERGEVLAGALVTDRVRRGVVILHEGAWYDPEAPEKDGSRCKHGLVNVLTLDKGTSQLAQGNVANTTLVEVKKHTDPLPAITAFEPPAITSQRG
ncbi:molybdopterin guanine dinucleotide-containing S/N-oxide reductase [bacterium]|nr:MAG: molybdopterin guanine dinucleotide-containing S/N-oxide reductase [bacterium]